MRERYPEARIDDVQDMLEGVSFADPYRWLEGKSEEVRRWQTAQAALASAHVREWPHFDLVQQLVARFSTERFVELPRYAGGKWFRMRTAQGASQASASVSDTAVGEGRVLFDPMREDPQRPPFLSWLAPSPDGRTLALGVCADGSENNTIRLVDVATGQELPEPPPHTLMDNRTGGVQWLHDSSGFFFSAITGTATDFEQQVYLHRRSPTPGTHPCGIPWTDAREYRMAMVSRDGRHAVAFERQRRPIPVAVAALDAVGRDPLPWRPFVTAIQDTLAGHVLGDQFIAVTDVGAPRGRLVAIALDASDPNDPKYWRELVPETDAVLRTVTPVGDVLYLTELVDAYARVRIVDLDGRPLGQVPLPARGAVNELPFPIMNLTRRGHPEKFVFAFSSLTVSPGIYSHTFCDPNLETLQEPKIQLKDAVVEDHCAISADGTRIPYRLVRRSDVCSSEPQPTLIYAYGGLNVAFVPQFPGAMAAFVAAGGVFVHAHLRGGSEFGSEWWQGGRLRNKQNCYDDLYAIAEQLIHSRRCTPRSLALVGGSNGGLMAGVALTQRPDLWAVVVPRVPILDLIGACRDRYGRIVIRDEFADVERSDEVRRLASFSPYHLVREGVRYPAIFLDAGDTDPRCPPWHARKFAARLQRAAAGNEPVLLHVWDNAGHGLATDKTLAAKQNTEWLAFTLRHVGMQDRALFTDQGS